METEIRIQRRAQILEAAALEFRERGFERAKIEEIAHRAGIGKSTVYEYFPSKDILLTEVLSQGMQHMNRLLRDFLRRPATLRAKLEGLFGKAGEMVRDSFVPLMAMRECAPALEFMRTHGQDEQAFIRSLLRESVVHAIEAGEIRHDLDPEFAATMAFALILAAGSNLMVKSDVGEDYIKKALDLLYDGIAPREG